MTPREAGDAVAAVQKKAPALTTFGIGIPDDPLKIQAQLEADMRDASADMMRDFCLRQFIRACAYLETRVKSEKMNTSMDSSSIKYHAQAFNTKLGRELVEHYISNGMLIAAAIHMGFTCRIAPANINVYMNIDEPSVKQNKGETLYDV